VEEKENQQKKVDETWKEKAKTESRDLPGQEPQEIPEANFKFFLTTLTMQAWIGLGAIPNPATDKTEKNLSQAKFIIDTIEMLEKKTKGNLDKEEADLLENILYELRVSYVNQTMKGDRP
jgi:hypothetical protein